MIGTTKTRQRSKADEISYTGTILGSTQGHVSLVAGRNVHITGSDVLSQAGTVITGQNVTIDAAVGTSDGHREYSMHKAGLMGGLGGVIGRIANGAYGAYNSTKRGGQVEDDRLKALYAAKAAYQVYDAYQAASAYGGSSTKRGSGAGGISLKISLGASTANSHTNTHDDIAYASHIRSQGDVTIAATNGDLNIIGSQIKGDDITLAASHDLNLLSQTLRHTEKHSGAHAGGKIGVSIGTTTGIFLSLNGGKAKAHGNGLTHQITTVDADGTLSLIAGHDALIKGAQARGETILADIGHNLILASEQDTGDFASKQWSAGFTLVYGWTSQGVGFSGHASAAGMNNHYKSVTQVTGLAAGDGGFQIHVGGNTDLTGAVIASTADPSKNLLDTGSLTYSDIQNQAKYDSWSFSIGGSAGQSLSGKSMGGLTGGIGVPQSNDQSGTTRAGIAQGTIAVRHGSRNLAGMDRNPDIDAKGLTREFDRQKLAEQQEMGKVAGYVGMRAAGDLASVMASKDANDGDVDGAKSWASGGTKEVVLHTLVGGAAAVLGGGNVLQGALGAGASEAAIPYLQKYGDNGVLVGTTLIGAIVGGGAGASTAAAGTQYNYLSHPQLEALQKKLDQQCGGNAQSACGTALIA